MPLARDVVWIFAGALAVRGGALALAIATGRFPEYWEPDVIARSLLAGHGFRYPFMGGHRWAYYEPLYPFVVAAVYAVSDFSALALALVQCVVSASVACVAWLLALRAFDRATALAAGALVAMHPGLAGYATKFHPLTFDALALVLAALAAVALVNRPRAGSAAALGGALGFGTLTRPTILAFAAALTVWVLASRRRRRAWPHLALALAIAAAVVTPWVVRNYVRLDAFVLTRSHVGFGFWLGNHPGAAGGEGDAADPTGERSPFDRAPAEFRQRVLTEAGEIAQDRVFMTSAVGYVAGDPAAFVSRTLTKLAYFWTFPPYLGKRYTRAETWLYRVGSVTALALAVVGLVRWRRCAAGPPDGVMVVLLLLASVSLAQSLFYVQGRHRIAVDPVLMVLTGHGLASLARRRG